MAAAPVTAIPAAAILAAPAAAVAPAIATSGIAWGSILGGVVGAAGAMQVANQQKDTPITVIVTPEPSSFMALGSALILTPAGIAIRRWRERR